MSSGAAVERLTTRIAARVMRHDLGYGLSTLHFSDGELRVPFVDLALGTGVAVEIDARDVSIALSRPMDVSITNRLPGTVVAVRALRLPYVAVCFDLGATRLEALVTQESVERLGLEVGVRAWAMIKTVAIEPAMISPEDLQPPRPWPTRR